MNKNDNKADYFDFGWIVRILWKYAVPILLVGILFAALLFLYARMFVTPRYEANVLLYVNNSTALLDGAARISTGELTAASDLVDTYVVILQSRSNMEKVIEESGVSYTYEQLCRMVSAKAVNSTGLFQVTVNSGDPEEACALANTIATILPDTISEIVTNSSVAVVDYAVTPHTRVSPSYVKYAAFGLLLGLVLGSAVVLLIRYFDDVIREEEYLLQNFDAPVLAAIPALAARKTKPLRFPVKKPRQQRSMLCEGLSFDAAEAYKCLRTNLLFSLPNKPCRILGVTSPARGEGKSTTAVNLAYTFAQAGKRTLLIDADMRMPGVASMLGISGVPGLSKLLAGLSSEEDCLQKSGCFDNWFVLPAGEIPPNPSELLGSERMRALLEHCAESFDFIIIDLPAVNMVTDAQVISGWTDGLIAVVRRNVTERKALNACMYQVRRLGAKFLGFVMTDAAVSESSYKHYGKYGHRYGYGYGYGYGYSGSKSSSKDKAFMNATVEEKVAVSTADTRE